MNKYRLALKQMGVAPQKLRTKSGWKSAERAPSSATDLVPRGKIAVTLCRAIMTVIVCAMVCASASAADYPTRPVHMIVPFAPGGVGDITGRIVGEALSRKWGVPVLIDNREGAGGNLGAGVAAHAAPDGYTIFQLNVANAISTTLYKKLNYDLSHDFLPVTEIAASPFVLAAAPSMNVKTVQEFLAKAKAHPGELTYGSSGNGSASDLVMQLLMSSAGIRLMHVPYSSSAALKSDLIAGYIGFTFATPSSVLPSIKAGQFIGLGVTSKSASSGLPSIAESGVPGFEGLTWLGLVVPAKTPDAIIAKLNADVVAVLAEPDVRERTLAQGLQPVGDTPAEFGKFINSEIEKWGRAVQLSGAKLE